MASSYSSLGAELMALGKFRYVGDKTNTNLNIMQQISVMLLNQYIETNNSFNCH